MAQLTLVRLIRERLSGSPITVQVTALDGTYLAGFSTMGRALSYCQMQGYKPAEAA